MVDITIQHKRSAQSGKAPTVSQLQLGEIAVNTYDGDVYIKKSVNGVEEVVTLKSTGIGNNTIDFVDVDNKPTTLAGYGITDAFSGDYDDLTDKPNLLLFQTVADAFDGDYNNLHNKPTIFDGQFPSLDQKPTTIAGYGITDAFDGDYNKLSNTIPIATDVSELADSTGLIFDGTWASLEGKPFENGTLSDLIDVSNTTPNVGQTIKWNGTLWAPDDDFGGTNADTFNNQGPTFYLEYSNFANTPAIPAVLTDLGISDGTADYVLQTDGNGNFSFQKGVKDISFFNAAIPSGSGAIGYSSGQARITYTPPDLSPYLTSYTETSTLQDVISRGASSANTAIIPFTYGTQLQFPTASSYEGAMAHSQAADSMYFANGGAWKKLANEDDVNGLIDFHLNQSSAGTGSVLGWSGSDYDWLDHTPNAIANVAEDTTPQLGANLDTNGKTISYTFSIAANLSSAYRFTDPGSVWFPSPEDNPTLYLRRGETYVFDNSVSGAHPLVIQSTSGTGGTAYNTGVTNNGNGSGDEVIFSVPMSAPATLYYQCDVHNAMGGTINII